MNKKYEKMAKDLSEAGRFGDTRILHVNEAELAGLGSLLPSGELPTNPETGQPEAGIITSLIIGAILGATSGGITAEQKGIPLWQGILQGAGIGMATGALTGGLGAAMGSGASAGAQAGTQAGIDASANTLVDASVQGALETGKAAAVEAGKTAAVETGKTAAVKTTEQAAMDTAFKEAAEAGVEEMIVTAPIESANQASGVIPFGQTGADITGASASGVASGGPAEFSGEALTVNAGEMSGAPPNTPPAEGPGFIDQVASEFTQEGLADSVSREALKEYAGNPLNYIAPVMATEALLPSEYDEEDYLAGYEGPYDKTWSSSPGVSWAANNGGEVKRRSARKEKKNRIPETPIQRVVRLAELAKRVTDPTLPGKYNPLSEEPVQIKIRPSVNPSGMHRFGVTLPFNQGGLASLRRR